MSLLLSFNFPAVSESYPPTTPTLFLLYRVYREQQGLIQYIRNTTWSPSSYKRKKTVKPFLTSFQLSLKKFLPSFASTTCLKTLITGQSRYCSHHLGSPLQNKSDMSFAFHLRTWNTTFLVVSEECLIQE